MNLYEYEKVKDYTYLEYCNYLQKKYGIGLAHILLRVGAKLKNVQEQKKVLLLIIITKIMRYY